MPTPNLHFQRFEFKYFLPKNKADKIIPALLNHMRWDPYISASGHDFYIVNSLYFDNHNFSCFWDKEAGVADRKKLRYRYYNQDKDNLFVEIKRKKDALVIKDRIKLNNSDNTSISQALYQFRLTHKDHRFSQEVSWFKTKNCLQPKIFLSYKRKALIGRIDPKFRVTFDYDIKATMSNNLSSNPYFYKNIYPKGTVLELKYNNVLPSWFHRIIQKYQLNRIAFSKYCNSVRVLMPQFDDNNYSPD